MRSAPPLQESSSQQAVQLSAEAPPFQPAAQPPAAPQPAASCESRNTWRAERSQLLPDASDGCATRLEAYMARQDAPPRR
jgi:hypothetical protein